MRKLVAFLLILLLCAAIPVAALENAEETMPIVGSGEVSNEVTAPRLFADEEIENELENELADTPEADEIITAPVLQEQASGGSRTGVIVAIVIVAVVAVAAVLFFLLRKKK